MCAQRVKKILVAGGAGFVGSHLCETLMEKGHVVICLDNLYTGSVKNIAHIEGLRWIEHDICDPIRLDVDEIYNLACPASPVHYQKDPLYTMKVSVLGSLNLLLLAEQTGARILQASTSEVYGDPLVHPQHEEYAGNVNPIGPRACYDEGKRCAETLFFDMMRQKDVNICVARIFNTYGPRMQSDDGRVVSNFIVQALRKDPLTIYGNGEQTRSFCFVDDLVFGLIALMESAEIGPFNLGNPAECTVKELAKLVLAMTGSPSKIIYKPLPLDDPKVRRPDITLAKNKLRWTPSVSLNEGLEKTISFFEKTAIML